MAAEGRQRARGLERAFAILEHLRLAQVPQRPSEIAQSLGAPKSTIYDLVALLTEMEVLEAIGTGGEVFLGRKVYLMGLAYQAGFNLLGRAEQVLKEIVGQTRETAQLCALDGNKYTVLRMEEGSRPFRIKGDVGARSPIPWTASGRLLLGHLDSAALRAFLPPEDLRLPNGRILSMEGFEAEIRLATVAGFFAFDSIVDSFTHCFAAPVRDGRGKVIATVCLVAPKADAAANFEHYKNVLIAAGAQLSRS